MTARWVPPNERGSFIARSYFGSTFGLIITFPLCGFVADRLGWEAAYYVVGAITLAWYVAWLLLVYDSPEDHPRISQEEKRRLRAALEEEDAAVAASTSGEPPSVPWRAILRSPPVYGLLATDVCNCWGLYTLATNGPSYLKFMLGLDLASTGVLSALPMLARYVGGVILSAGADWLLRRRLLSRTNVRRVFNTISQCAPALAMALLAFSGCDVAYAMGLLCVGWFFNGALASSHMVSHVDLAPNFAGTLFGLTNTFSGGATSFIVRDRIEIQIVLLVLYKILLTPLLSRLRCLP